MQTVKVVDVVEFLHSIGLDQHVDRFREQGFDGELLLAAKDQQLNALGVSNPLHCFKIQYLFKRWLHKTSTTHAQGTVYDFLAANKMDKYGQRFAEEGVDGDMLLEILHLDPDVRARILEVLGIKDSMDILIKFNPSAHATQEGICIAYQYITNPITFFFYRNCTH